MCYLNKLFKKITLIACLVLTSPWAYSASVIQMDVDQLLQSAELIFEGEVIDSQSRFNAAGTSINTYVTFQIADVISGNYVEPTIELSFSGGVAQNLGMQVVGMIYPQVGEKGIYFIEEVGQVFVNPIVGWSQGHFLIKVDSNGLERMSTAEEVAIIELNNERAQAGTISQGVASGIQTRRTNVQSSEAMLKSEFKQKLIDKLNTRTR